MNLFPVFIAIAGLLAGQGAALTQEQGPAPVLPPPAETETGPPDGIALVMAQHYAASDCEDPQSELLRENPGITAQIGPTSTLYALPCTKSGGRVAYRLYAHETGEIGGVKTLYFARFTRTHGWSGTDLLADIAVDGPALRAFLPAEDGSLCGYGEWTFTDYAYRLDRFATDARCDARPPAEWTTLYPRG